MGIRRVGLDEPRLSCLETAARVLYSGGTRTRVPAKEKKKTSKGMDDRLGRKGRAGILGVALGGFWRGESGMAGQAVLGRSGHESP